MNQTKFTLSLILTPLLFLFALTAFGQEKSKAMQEGTKYFFDKEYDKALKSFQKEYKKAPSIEVKFWIAHTYAEMKEVQKAKSLFIEIVKSNYSGPEMSMSLNNLGICYVKTKQNDSAYFYFDIAIKNYPKFSDPYLNKGQLLYQESKFDEAKKFLNTAVELDSDNWWVYQKRLEVCFASQDYEGALRDLIKVKTLKPDEKIEMNLAYCYTMLQRYHEADSIFQLIYDEKDALFLNNYGMNKHNMGNTSEGKMYIMKSLDIKPNNSYAYRNLAVIAIQENDKVKACEHLIKAKSLEFEKYYGREVNDLLREHCE